MERLSPVVKNLLILNIGMFILQQLVPGTIDGNGYEVPPQWDNEPLTYWFSQYDLRSPFFKPYQLFTSMFIHYDFSHILMNMLGLFMMGPILESYVGDKKFVLLYMSAGLAGSFLTITLSYYFTTDPGYIIYAASAGASGAVLGVVTAVAMIVPNLPVQLMFIPIPFKLKYGAMAFIAYDLYGAFRMTHGIHTGVGHFAHLGGAILGAILILLWRKNSNMFNNRWD